MVEQFFMIKGINNNLVFFDPYIESKGVLSFMNCNMPNFTGKFTGKNGIELDMDGQSILLKITKEEQKALNNTLESLTREANEFYAECTQGTVTLIISDNNVTTDEVIENYNSSYYKKILRDRIQYWTSSLVKGTDEEKFQEDFSNYIKNKKLSKFKDGDVIKVTFKELLKA